MNRLSIKRISVAAGLFSFALVFFGSWGYGARIITSFVRGLEGFAIFGLLTWLVLQGWAALKPDEREGEGKSKGVNLDQTA